MISIFFSLMMATGALASEPIPAGCTASPNFSAEAYSMWISPSFPQTAGEDAGHSSPIPVSQRAEIQLIPTATESHGFVTFEIPAPGTYVIATDAYPRMDLVELSTGENLNPVDFGKIRDCGTVSKALRFNFTQAGKFQLGFVSSQGPLLNVLIWRLN